MALWPSRLKSPSLSGPETDSLLGAESSAPPPRPSVSRLKKPSAELLLLQLEVRQDGVKLCGYQILPLAGFPCSRSFTLGSAIWSDPDSSVLEAPCRGIVHRFHTV